LWKLKDEALDRTLRRTGFGRGYGPVVRRTKWRWRASPARNGKNKLEMK